MLSNIYAEYKKYVEALEDFARLLTYKTSPIPAWVWIIIGSIIAGGGGLVLYRFWQATQPIVESVQQYAPMIGMAISSMLFILNLMPFFFIAQLIVSMMGAFI
jgi:hypothetical protein